VATSRVLSGILLLWMACTSVCIAQQPLYNYLHFTTRDGLPSNRIRAVKQDKEGLLWMTTAKGLAYFDGNRFFPVDFNQGNALFSNDFGQLSLSADGRKIWITTYNQGLLCYDRTQPLEKAVTSYGVKVANKETELEKHELYTVHVASSGLVYFGGQETDLQVLDPATNTVTSIKLNDESKFQTLYSIQEDKQGLLWIGTRYGGAYSYNPKTKAITAYNLHNQGENGATGVCFVNDTVFMSYYDHDLVKIDTDRKEIVAKDLLGIGTNQQPYQNVIMDIVYLPDQQTLLAAHVQDGLYQYDLRTGSRRLVRWVDILPKEPVPSRINSIYVVTDGYFLCTNNGLLYYSKQFNRLQEYIPAIQKPIERIFKISSDLWYVDRSSMGKLSADFKHRLSAIDLQGLRVSQYNVIEKTIYLSTYDKGVYVCDTDNPRISPLPIEGPTFGFEKADCNTILADTIDGESVLWIGSWNSGVYRYHIRTKRMTLFNQDQGLADHKVITLGKNKQNHIWIGTDGYGAIRIDDKLQGKFTHFQHTSSPLSVASNTVFAFLLDANDKFWYSNGQSGIGLIKDSPDGVSFQQLRDNNRFPWTYTYALKEDKKNRIWMATPEGVMLFHKEAGPFYQLYPGDGIFPPEQFKAFHFYFDEETLVWTTDKGLLKGKIDAVDNTEITLFMPAISTFKILNKDHTYKLLQQPIRLASHENTFSFTFSVPQLIKNNRVRYAYRLEGVDSDWLMADSYQQAVYTNVQGGHYTFHLKVSDLEGNWSDRILSIPVYVQTNWYQTIWFRTTAVILLFLAVIFFFAYRIRQQKHVHQLQRAFTITLQQELLANEKKIKEQAEILELEKQQKLESEFKQKLYESELKAIRSQMNPHFIFNILNSIEAYVVENDAHSASKLIHKFAALSRIVLENSQFAMVSIASELQLVKLYLELERERFAHDFDYEVLVQDGLDVAVKKIPSMLIQPIVENAVHHGIRHLVGRSGKIKIVIVEENDRIIIEVWDNGVGFDNVKKMKTSFFKNISFGLKGVQDRIEMINNGLLAPIARLHVETTVADVHFSTKVTIELPSAE